MLILAGNHRSGTSLLAQLFDAAGVYLGEELLPGNESNRHGHYEDVEVVAIHERLLADNGLTWRVGGDFIPCVNDDLWARMRDFVVRRNSAHAIWGFKDPRACLFLALWKSVAPEAKIVGIVRDPAQCVESLARREVEAALRGSGLRENCLDLFGQQDLGLRVWLTHNRCLLRAADAYSGDVVIWNFEDLVADSDIIGVSEQVLGLSGLRLARSSNLLDADSVTAHDSHLRICNGRLVDEAYELWDRLSARAASPCARSHGQAGTR